MLRAKKWPRPDALEGAVYALVFIFVFLLVYRYLS
jgi:hypothetical protein